MVCSGSAITTVVTLGLIAVALGQKSFAETRFDLSPDLPVEDINPAFSEDDTPKQIIKAEEKKKVFAPTQQVPISTSSVSPLSPTTSALPTFSNLPDATLAPSISLPTFTFPPMPTMTPFSIATFSPPTFPLNQQPQNPEIPQVPQILETSKIPQTPQAPQIPQVPQVPRSPASFLFYPPQTATSVPFVNPVTSVQQPQASSSVPAPTQAIETQQFVSPSPSQPKFATPISSLPLQPSVFIPPHGSKSIQLVAANQFRDRADLWFKESFNFSSCSRNVVGVSNSFLKKFPLNILKDGKERVLAELLLSRLKECVRKQKANEWAEIDHKIAILNLPASEKKECRFGLIQELISCYNVQSFACQFVQPRYVFRLVPARIIIQEARLAEDGAEKCRKVVRTLKKKKLIN